VIRWRVAETGVEAEAGYETKSGKINVDTAKEKRITLGVLRGGRCLQFTPHRRWVFVSIGAGVSPTAVSSFLSAQMRKPNESGQRACPAPDQHGSMADRTTTDCPPESEVTSGAQSSVKDPVRNAPVVPHKRGESATGGHCRLAACSPPAETRENRRSGRSILSCGAIDPEQVAIRIVCHSNDD